MHILLHLPVLTIRFEHTISDTTEIESESELPWLRRLIFSSATTPASI